FGPNSSHQDHERLFVCLFGRDVPDGSRILRLAGPAVATGDHVSLDKEIVDAFSLIGLLLVFVAGYFSALLPTVEQLSQERVPDDWVHRRGLKSRLKSYRKLLRILLVLIASIVVLLLPLTKRVLVQWSLNWPFPTVQAGS